MASDLSNIFKDELANTLEQLLSNSSQVETVNPLAIENYESSQFIEAEVKFDFKAISSTCYFYVPTISATKFEYLMLGGMGDLKEHIDDEITDAVNEIISNICGSFCTAVNAQGFADVESIKAEVVGSKIVELDVLEAKNNSYEFIIALGDEKLPLILSFDEIILPFFSTIVGNSVGTVEEPSSHSVQAPVQNMKSSVENTYKPPRNLELLYDVKLKLSVRLGTKIVLLKDILKWDVGEIIELEQMVNEPLEVLVNGVKIGEGEAVIVEGKFGLKIKKIGNEDLRLSQIGM
ncbi:FliM/FliN family flagellar motor switch protein [Malaciobacter sp. WC5094]|uniref:FliM/FliN family flagellar motor switch protein n=1 Tax=Arcobacter sp. YIC-80 TaxID=3376683 RepID=UPI00384AEAA9